MKNELLFKYCGYLVTAYGYILSYFKSNKPKSGIYVDPHGCDLEIHYGAVNTEAAIKNYITVYFGGRLVFQYLPSMKTQCEKEEIVNGCWIDLVLALYDTEKNNQNSYRREQPFLNYSLIWYCQKEAKRNRNFLKKYYDICSSVIEKYGEKGKWADDAQYVIPDDTNECKIIHLYEGFSVVWNGEIVFRCNKDDGELKGKFERGGWEQALKNFYKTMVQNN